ncbi:dipeptidyl peptidase IV N-terminal region-domain-containing protein [Crucibulum laeve]|uniref:Dipeptidyl peptidase IV N-terminal region-domain-containing protein n=1 Tax=Crucibulum laeve TaxID=68775 RepID=A0A5C3LMU7_9AGAR|nr:dipeptidyl peptidase IV N-terminal region-domain-containing protein [Crucibulum laeve]
MATSSLAEYNTGAHESNSTLTQTSAEYYDDQHVSDNEDEGLLRKDKVLNGEVEEEPPLSPGRAERGRFPRGEDADPKRPASLKALLIILSGLVFLAALIGIIAAHTYAGSAGYHAPGVRKVTMDHIFNGTFSGQRVGINWVKEAGDGVFSQAEFGQVKLVDLKTNTTTSLVDQKDVKDEHGNPLFMFDWQLSPNMKQILLKADYRKQWRHSSFGNYYIHDIASKKTYPLIPPSNPAKTQLAVWSPTGDAIAYVLESDLYVVPSAGPDADKTHIRLTHTGTATLFNGVPDWVYEEEVFSGPSAIWWSPDSSHLAFLSFDETLVPEFKFPIYNPTDDSDAVVPYTEDVVMRYPKPGFENPTVEVRVFDLKGYLASNATSSTSTSDKAENPENHIHLLTWDARLPAKDSIVQEVAWVGNTSLLLKEVNRNADSGNVILFDAGFSATAFTVPGHAVRKLGKDGEQGDDGWIDADQNVVPIPHIPGVPPGAPGRNSYLDIVPTKEGFNHIALFNVASLSKPIFLTSGEWEVTGGIKGIDTLRGLVYFEAANPSSTQRHLYSVPLPKDLANIRAETFKKVEPTPLTDPTKPSFYSSEFSPQAGFYVLNYHGPTVPWQKIVKVGDQAFNYPLTKNERLTNATLEYEAATITHSTITSDGFELNVKEIRPPRMDDSGRTKYPVLFRVYGGPGSQLVDLRFQRDWHDYLACGLQYIIVIVDGRGTGFKGRKLRNTVKGNLGFWETKDQVAAAKIWAAKEYVDPKRIGIWGWSYGGFMSSKVVEANAGVHSLAMAVAPVTSWRLYDSIYTERYMNLPLLNPSGYINASISNVTGFHHTDFLLAHGSGDDNVHYANSAHLLDMFTKAQVRGYRFRMFVDR